MKPRTRATTKKSEPLLSLQAKVLSRDRDGRLSDVTHQNQFDLNEVAEDGALAIHILNNCRKRLELLSMAAENRSQIEAGLVRLALDDLRIDLEEAGELAVYLDRTHELFCSSQAIAP